MACNVHMFEILNVNISNQYRMVQCKKKKMVLVKLDVHGKSKLRICDHASMNDVDGSA